MPFTAPPITAYLENPFTWWAFIFGALIGSFLNVCIYRIPEGRFFAQARSHCRHCDAPIPWFLNIPIFSWLALRAKARCCQKPISPLYPSVELFMAIAMVVTYWKWPFLVLGQHPPIDLNEAIRFGHGALFLAAMVCVSVIDLRLMIIPDVISLGMVMLSPLCVLIHPELDFYSSLIGIGAGFLSLFSISYGYYLLRRQVGLGMGDIKLMAAIGGWLGWQSLVPTMVIASVSACIVALILITFHRSTTLKTPLPFGPFLAFGALNHIYGSEALPFFLSLFAPLNTQGP